MKKIRVSVDNNAKLKCLTDALERHGLEASENYTVDADKRVVDFQYEDDRDLFDIGIEYGYELHHERAQKFHLHRDYCNILREAIDLWQKETHMANSSIFFKQAEMADTEMELVYVEPTTLMAMFQIFSRYGQLIAKRKQTA